MNKPTKEQQKAALKLIEEKMKNVKAPVNFLKVCIDNPIVKECEAIAEAAGVSFRIHTNFAEDLTYWPQSPHKNGWYDPEDDDFYSPDTYQGWMSSTDQCYASY